MSLEDSLTTETLNPRSRGLDSFSAVGIVHLMTSGDANAVKAVRAESGAIAQAIDFVADRFRRGGGSDPRWRGNLGTARGAGRLGVPTHLQPAAQARSSG